MYNNDKQARYSDISTRHVIMSMLIECWNIKKKRPNSANYSFCVGGVVLAGPI